VSGRPLADAASGLAAALGRELDVTVVSALPDGVDPLRHGLAKRLTPLAVDGDAVDVYDGALPAGFARLAAVECGGSDELLCRTALAYAAEPSRWPAIVHAFDARVAGVVALAAARTDPSPGMPAPATVLSVHDAAGGDELRAAIAAADRIVTPSPRWGDDLTAGAPLAAATDKLRGIAGGIDVSRWNPRFDPALPARFDAADRFGKAACKTALQRALGLPRRPRVPLVGVLDDVADDIDAAGVQLAVDRSSSDAILAHRIVGGADFLWIPSPMDPDRPNRLYCMRYGTIPIVPRAGGVGETVVDFDEATATGSAIVYDDGDPDAIRAALARAARVYASPAMQPLIDRAMAFDLSWTSAARHYTDVYRELLPAT